MDAVNKFLSEQSWTPNLRFISGYHDNDNYIDSISKSIEDSFQKMEDLINSFSAIMVCLNVLT